jgi:uridylate kinase
VFSLLKEFKSESPVLTSAKERERMRVVLRIGGSVVASPVNVELLGRYAEMLKVLRKQGHEVAAVVGGGKLAREFIKTAKDLGLSSQAQDEIAISVSRLFAQLLLKKIGTAACRRVALTLDDAAECLQRGRIMVMGGLKPGITTDAVASLVAERVHADLLVKGTDQDGVYDKDPRKHVDAIKLDHMFLDDLCKVLELSKHEAGLHQVVDPVAVGILKRARLKLVVVNGFKPENVLAAINGENVGTTID